jgi:hypothetical protein
LSPFLWNDADLCISSEFRCTLLLDPGTMMGPRGDERRCGS